MIQASNLLFRGPRPNSFEELDKHGIKAVINLQSGIYEKLHNDSYEREDAADWDMWEYNAPCSDFTPPSLRTTTAVFYTIRNHVSERHPVYIHCLHGKDRTGFNVAYYRMKQDKLSFVAAVKEMFAHGFHKWPYIWWVPFLLIYSWIDSISDHRTQDLRDNDRDRKEYVFNKRGWFPKWRWQFLISRNPFKMYKLLALNVELTPNKNFIGFSFGFFGVQLYVHLSKYDDSSIARDYGFYFDTDALVLRWANPHFDSGGFIKFLYYPWSYDYCQTEFIDKSGGWVTEPRDWKAREALRKATLLEEVFDYTYVLKSGEIQKRKATVCTERRTWWQRWFGLGRHHLTPWKSSTSIDVRFDEEVGEKTGSWKGGTVGCGYDLRKGETPEQCLRRMELERKF